MAPSRARVLVGGRWSVVLSAQDCEFVAKHDDLEVLRVSRAQSQACQRGEEPVQNATHATPKIGSVTPVQRAMTEFGHPRRMQRIMPGQRTRPHSWAPTSRDYAAIREGVAQTGRTKRR